MKPVDVKSNSYVNSSKEINGRDPKFKIGNFIRISKYKKNLEKATFQIGLQKFLWLEKLKTLWRGYMIRVVLSEKKLLECFTKKSCKKQIKKSL